MLVLNAAQASSLATLPQLIACLEEAFGSDAVVPKRQVLAMPGGTGERLFLTMPAFGGAGDGAIKLATFVPENAALGLPVVQAAIVLFSEQGTPVALLDGTVVTRLRTGAASALASKYLSRPDSKHLAILGTGALAPTMAVAHAAVRSLQTIRVWGRRADAAERTAGAIRRELGDSVEVIPCLGGEEAVAGADIVSCVTSSSTPILEGRWLRRGAFVDLVGSFTPAMREADDQTVGSARIFVDTFAGALEEAGDILDPLSRGIIQRRQVEGELADLVRGRARGRLGDEEIIVFKSVGTALEDLAAARLIVAAAERSVG